MDNMMSLKNVTKKYDGFTLENISFSLKKGYVMGFIGPNGSGKTTTIKLIMNLLNRDSGSIDLFGLDNRANERAVKNEIGFIYDSNCFYDELTLSETKFFYSRFYSGWSDSVFSDYARRFELPLSKKVKKLSKGMQMKFSIALALSHDPKLVIMDEPTSGLDPVFRRELLDILLEIMQDDKKSIFFSTHITADLEKIADYITFINAGRLVFSEEKDSIMEMYRIVKGSNELMNSGSCVDSLFCGIRRNKFGFEAMTDNAEAVKNLFAGKVHIENASLDDIMFFTKRGGQND